METAVKEAKDVILGEIQKSDREKIVVSLKQYQGHKYVDLRIHFKTDTGGWHFTKKGITLNPAKVKDLMVMLQKV
ncbi:MAG: transcriptional coactivator p15/PC4 family protein [Candidatus Kuenenia stuttgartiensis]|nr:transcriptional coactivator p15/PC4 family protein [Candidatus Kuenenia stuttgartiensis]